MVCKGGADALEAAGTDGACMAPQVPHQVPEALSRFARAADRTHRDDACVPEAASVDLAPHDDATHALTSATSAPQQLLQVAEQASSAEAGAAGETPSSDRGMPVTDSDGAASTCRIVVCAALIRCLHCQRGLNTVVGKILCAYPDCKRAITVLPQQNRCPTCQQLFYLVQYDQHVAGCKPASEVPADAHGY